MVVTLWQISVRKAIDIYLKGWNIPPRLFALVYHTCFFKQ